MVEVIGDALDGQVRLPVELPLLAVKRKVGTELQSAQASVVSQWEGFAVSKAFLVLNNRNDLTSVCYLACSKT